MTPIPTDDGGYHDVAILGGGPAGCAAGLTLLQREDLKVVMIERSDYGGPRIGESLSPGTRPLLDYLGVWEAFRATQPLEAFGSRSAWGSETPGALDYLFTLHGTGWSLDRQAFDRMLATRFRAHGGMLWEDARWRGGRRLATGDWQLDLQATDGRRPSLRARYLVDASGRSGRLARWLGQHRIHHDRLVGIGRECRLPATSRVEATIQVEACEYGWWYTAPTPDRRMMVVLMTDADLAHGLGALRPERWEALLAAMPLASATTRGGRFAQRPRSFPAHSSLLSHPGGDGWVAVGDAASARDPLSSTGIPYALGSGVHGALVAVNALLGKADMLPSYARSLREDFQGYLAMHWGIYRREARWPRHPFWQRRRTPVTLDPMATISDVSTTARHGPLPTTHLAEPQVRELLAHCRPGHPTHHSVRALAAAHPELPDQRIILGLQELVEAGLVSLAPTQSKAASPA